MLEIKDGVQPPVFHIIAIVANIANGRNITLRITSGLDGKHSKYSGHYQLRCVDVGTKEHPEDILTSLCNEIRAAMELVFPPDRVYVQIHNQGDRGPTGNEHMHVQFK